jgi:FixJ family two-component response regulator
MNGRMPDLSIYWPFATAVMQRRLAYKIAFMTAYGDAAIRREIESLPHVAFFQKPVSYGSLGRLVDAAGSSAPAVRLET